MRPAIGLDSWEGPEGSGIPIGWDLDVVGALAFSHQVEN